MSVLESPAEADMVKVKGIYDGASVILLEPVTLPPETQVEVLIPLPESDEEQVYWQKLVASGLVKEIRSRPISSTPFAPRQVEGAPVSSTIIDERR